MKKSFFERLTGSHTEENEQEERNVPIIDTIPKNAVTKTKAITSTDIEEESEDGQLAIDVYQTPTEIIVKAITPGINPDDLDLTITRDMVTLKGERKNEELVEEENFFYQELYWGSFSRSISLPQEINTDEAQAEIKKGVLTIRLPKLDKNKTQKIKVKNG